MRRLLPLLYAPLLVLGIPWYWPADDRTLVLGVPGWVAVAVVVSFAASCLTAGLLAKPWPGERDSGADAEDD